MVILAIIRQFQRKKDNLIEWIHEKCCTFWFDQERVNMSHVCTIVYGSLIMCDPKRIPLVVNKNNVGQIMLSTHNVC